MLDLCIWTTQGQGFMVGVHIDPMPGLPSGFPVILTCPFSITLPWILILYGTERSLFLVNLPAQELLQFVLEHVEDKNVEPLLEVTE